MSVYGILLTFAWLAHRLPQLAPLPAVEIRRPPEEVRAIYVTADTAQHPRIEELIGLVDRSELNAVVINVKEPSGTKFWDGLGPLVARLKQHGIWTIARLVVFQDDELAKRDRRLALQRADGHRWRYRSGRLWLYPAAREVWRYNAAVGKRALALGFDELNLDYIRFPADGRLASIIYPAWNRRQSREQVVADFASWIVREIKNFRPHAVISADIFGFTLVQDWDLDIGQRARLLAERFDVLAPMLYPSHYSQGDFSWLKPAEHPYDVVSRTLNSGRVIVGGSGVMVRPWLQDFDLGASYTPAMVRSEIRAVSDSGFAGGWMLWNPANTYTAEALQPG